MPARSKAQFKLMAWLAHGKGAPAGKGKFKGLTKGKAQEFVDATPNYKSLPAHAKGSSGHGKHDMGDM